MPDLIDALQPMLERVRRLLGAAATDDLTGSTAVWNPERIFPWLGVADSPSREERAYMNQGERYEALLFAARALYGEWEARQPGPGAYVVPGEEPTSDDLYWDELIGQVGIALMGFPEDESGSETQQIFVIGLRFDDGIPGLNYEAGYYYADTAEEAVDLALLGLSDHDRFAVEEIRAIRWSDLPDVVLPHRELPELRP